MGLFSEVAAEVHAKSLEPVLRAAIETHDEKIIAFCRQHLWPIYQDDVGETWGAYNGSPELAQVFGKI